MGVKERRLREKNQRRQEILSAAESVFSNKGFDKSTMDDVATAAELSKGAVYFYFNSKAEICLSILLQSLQEIMDLFRGIEVESISGYEKFHKMCQVMGTYNESHPFFIKAVANFRHHKELCDNSSPVLQEVLSANADLTLMLQTATALGMSDGSIDSSVNPNVLADAFWGDLNGILPALCLMDHDDLEHEKPSLHKFNYMIQLIINSIKSK